MTGPLDGITVLDTSERSPAAAVAGMLLSDLGANVVRVEPPAGDALRELDAHQVWFRGQQSVTVNEDGPSREDWERLRDRADVVVHTAQPRQDKPDLIGGWTPGPGQVLAVLTAAPRRIADSRHADASDQPVYGELVEAQYGLLDDQQGHRDGPIYLGWPLATYGAAWLLTLGVLAALWDPKTQTHGQTLTTSLVDGLAYLSVGRWSGGSKLPPPPVRASHKQPPPVRLSRTVISLFECGDGEWLVVHTMARGAFDRLMEIIGRVDLIDTSNTDLFSQLDPNVAAKMWEDIERTFASAPAQHWFEVLSGADIPCMVANPAGRALLIEQYAINGLCAQGSDRVELGAVAKYARTPMQVRLEVPGPGTTSIANLLADTLSGIRPSLKSNGTSRPSETSDTPRGPLEGLLVLDFGVFLAGPFSGRLMADLGARVIKIEETRGDPFRGPNGYFLSCGRGKESLAVNLKESQGRELVYELVKRADVVHSNMRLAALERLGVDYTSLRAVNPGLIYCHSSGYGNDGPWSHLPTFEPLHSASSGVLHRTGGAGNPPLNYLSTMDLGCGLTSTICVLAALIERKHSGEGQYLEVPQTGAGLLAMSDVYLQGQEVHETYPLDAAQRGHALTSAIYETSDGWILVSAYDASEWEGARRALQAEDDSWPDFARARSTLPGEGPDAALLDKAFAAMSTVSAQQALEANQVPCTVPTPFDLRRLPIDPLFRELGVIVVEDQADYGGVWETGHGVRFSGSTAQHQRPAPAIGQHSRDILLELGLTDDEISVLVTEGVVVSSGES